MTTAEPLAARLIAAAEHLDVRASEAYAAAAPFPHAVIDDVLPADVFADAVAEFPPIDDAGWDGYLHVNETKFANPRWDTWGPTLQAIAATFNSPEFVGILEQLTGIDGLLPDPDLDGGGLHQTVRGGHLNVHTDFSTHHARPTWSRRVNALLYLNEHWDQAWGGALELWDADVRTCVRRVEPLPNRLLVFTTDDRSFHGHPDPLRCPPGVARRSLALYYFTEDDAVARRPTHYRGRPGDGAKAFAIWADGRVLAAYDRVRAALGRSDAMGARWLERAHALIHRRRPQ